MQSAPSPEHSPPVNPNISSKVNNEYQDCLACRVIGTTALAGLGVHALNQSRAHQPGTPMGKRAMAGVGVRAFVPLTSRN